MACLALELVGHWVVLGFTVGMEAFNELLSINVPWSQEGREELLHVQGKKGRPCPR